MESNAIYTTSDAGLNRFFGKIYGLVGMGVGLSAVISYLMLFPLSHLFVNILMNYSWVYMAALFLEFGLVFLASGAARRNTPAALPLFLVYSALNGFTLSFIIVQYTQAIVFQAFLSTAIVFFIMALIGVTIKRDLSGMAKFLMAALIGIIVASLINIFFASSMMSSLGSYADWSFVISIVSILIFSGLIAYDNQMIKKVYYGTNGQVTDGWAVSMALSLYLDFINLFLNILRLFARRN